MRVYKARRMLTPSELASLAGVDVRFVRADVRAGTLPAFLIGLRLYRIRHDHAVEYLRRVAGWSSAQVAEFEDASPLIQVGPSLRPGVLAKLLHVTTQHLRNMVKRDEIPNGWPHSPYQSKGLHFDSLDFYEVFCGEHHSENSP